MAIAIYRCGHAHEPFTHQLQKLITNGGADAMKRSCRDTLMYINTALRYSFERHSRLDLHLCVRNIVFCRIRRLFIVSALPFMQRLALF